MTAGAHSRSVVIANRRGLHARAAAKFVKLADKFSAEISVCKDGVAVSGHSIMGLMMLAASPGCAIELRASGTEAEIALEALAHLVESGFYED